MEAVGWEAIVQRAYAAVHDLPATTVLCRLSMGARVVGAMWPERLDAAAAILLHAPTTVPRGVRPGTPVQVHVAVDGPFAPADQVVAFHGSAARTDAELPDHDRSAADVAWRRVGALLEGIR
jgi:hypothetical protein